MDNISNKLTIQEMLFRITRSSNKSYKNIALRILSQESSVEIELKYSSNFMTSVLNGDYDIALKRADSEHYKLLT